MCFLISRIKWATRRFFFEIDVLAKLKILSGFETVSQSIWNLTDSVPFNIWPRLGTFHLHLQKTNCIERQIQENNKSKHAACIHCLVSSLLMSSEGLALCYPWFKQYVYIVRASASHWIRVNVYGSEQCHFLNNEQSLELKRLGNQKLAWSL